MAPEQMRSLKDVDARTDIWALGTILHELLSGRPPWSATTLTELCASILQDPPPPIRSIRPDVPPQLEAVIARCLAKDPAGRYPDVAALAMELHGFASAAGRNNAERIFGVYRAAAATPRGSKPPSAMESARTAIDPTGPKLPIAVITPRSLPPVGHATTGKGWEAGALVPPVNSTPPPRGGDWLVLVLVALVVMLGTIVAVVVVKPRFDHSTAAPAVSARELPSAAVSVSVAPPEPVISASASAAPVVSAKPKPQPAAPSKPAAAPAKTTTEDCKVPQYYDAQGKKHWKPECVN
jgi:serine/threonine-protein kinase